MKKRKVATNTSYRCLQASRSHTLQHAYSHAAADRQRPITAPLQCPGIMSVRCASARALEVINATFAEPRVGVAVVVLA